ncbi:MULTISPECIES: caspase domain-containing protein [Pirellulaceae]|uniref:caspase family protein n=1 Tax=Pirellulaceae TaxID=2691357 RepID=UPI001304A66F|nr:MULTISPECIES: caspase family protein [Pirellulaceae]
MKLAILIAIEQYADSRIKRARYAESDATALAGVLQQHEFAGADRVVILSSEATHKQVKSRVQRAIKGLHHDDELFVYYAGHGFSKKGVNYLTCHDTNPDDLTRTSIKLAWLFDQFQKSACQQVAFFLDACEKGLLTTDDLRDRYAPLNDAELETFFGASQHRACFASCRPGETSHANAKLRHGVWAYHLIETLGGNAPRALERSKSLTAGSLQNYLQQAVPGTLRTLYATKRVQTPWYVDSSEGEFLLADMTELLAQRKGTAKADAGTVRSVTLLAKKAVRVRNLAGFRRSNHTVPTQNNTAADAFLAKIAKEEIDEDINTVFRSLRDLFRFKRTAMNVSNHGDGTATIITPYFNYSIAVHLDENDPSMAIWLRSVDAIKEPDQIFSEPFAQLFDQVFNTVVFEMPQRAELTELIDRLEDFEDDRITLDYDPDVTYCSVSIAGIPGKVSVTPSQLSITHKKPASPRTLLESLLAIQEMFVDRHDVPAISFRDTTKD